MPRVFRDRSAASVNRDPPVRPEPQVQQETRDNLDQMVKQDLGVNQGQMETPVVQDSQDFQVDPDLRVLQDQPEARVFKDQLETMELQDLRDSPDHPEPQELMEVLDPLVQQDNQGLRVLTVEWVLRVQQGHRALGVTQGLGGTMVQPVSPVLREPLVLQESLECRDPQVLPVSLVLPGSREPPDRPETLVLQATLAHPELWDLTEWREHQDLREFRVSRDRMVLQVRQVSKDRPVPQALRELTEPQALQDLVEPREILDQQVTTEVLVLRVP